jgi:type IV secretory pathway TrbL component
MLLVPSLNGSPNAAMQIGRTRSNQSHDGRATQDVRSPFGFGNSESHSTGTE